MHGQIKSKLERGGDKHLGILFKIEAFWGKIYLQSELQFKRNIPPLWAGGLRLLEATFQGDAETTGRLGFPHVSNEVPHKVSDDIV